MTLKYLPFVVNALGDKNQVVAVQSLSLIQRLKSNKSQYYTYGVELEERDPFFLKNVITPNLDTFLNLLRTKPTKDICMGVLGVLGETPYLRNSVQYYRFAFHHSLILIPQQTSNEHRTSINYLWLCGCCSVSCTRCFAGRVRLGFTLPHIQHIPLFFGVLHPNNTLIRHFVKMLQLHVNIMSVASCHKLFPSSIVDTMVLYFSAALISSYDTGIHQWEQLGYKF